MDLAGVGRAVVVPPAWEGCRNDATLDAAHRYPDRFAAMARLDLEDPASRDLLERLAPEPGIVGIRQLFHGEFAHLLGATTDWLWETAQRLDLPVMAFAPKGLGEIERIARDHPDLRLSLDHLGIWPSMAPEAFETLDDVIALASLPNITVKLTGVPGLSRLSYPFADTHDALRRLFDAFGPHRLFWGTDLTRLSCPYHHCITQFTEELPWLTGRDLDLVMGGAIAEWLRWPLPI